MTKKILNLKMFWKIRKKIEKNLRFCGKIMIIFYWRKHSMADYFLK